MTKARYTQVSLEDTQYYHCVMRCVRRAFLCGTDSASKQNYDHRKQWVEDKLTELAEIFAIDICAYAIMSNHYHIVLHVDFDQAQEWTLTEVIQRWCQLFKGSLLTDRYLSGEALSPAELDKVTEIVNKWRKRLYDLSWFMRCLNEHIARQANAEDHCKGRFWEGRFKSQALLDERAILACMMYVDLNPVRAGISDTPEDSDYTSIQTRIRQYYAERHQQVINQEVEAKPEPTLLPFTGDIHQNQPMGIPYHFLDYLELIDWTGRAIRNDKRGSIPEGAPAILSRLHIDRNDWVTSVKNYGRTPRAFVGCLEKMQAVCQSLERSWVWQHPINKMLYPLTG